MHFYARAAPRIVDNIKKTPVYLHDVIVIVTTNNIWTRVEINILGKNRLTDI